ncbi:MAG: DNA-binding protein [Candidatus Melainabacteria bacterium]|jgi:excisionase family DNA binding protein|nr:MAG: DNA-binding protein [Candidatus Melainabacteria bacterium]
MEPLSNTLSFERFRSELLTRKEAALYLGVTEQTLAVWKCTKRYNLPVVKVGRLVKYKKSDLDQFIKIRTLGAFPPSAS